MTEGPGKSELERLEQNLAGAAAFAQRAELDVPAFFNHEHGPALTFFSSVEDGVPRLNAHWRFEGRDQVIVLGLGDVRQLRDFCDRWTYAGMTSTEMLAECDAGLARVRQWLTLAKARQL